MSDLEEAGGVDADGDGIADGLVPASSLPDADGDGTPDFQEPGTEPEVGAATGVILTGLEGGGCAISPALLTKGHVPTKVDPTLPLLSGLALIGLAVRRRTVKVAKQTAKHTVSARRVAAVAIGALFLGGCSSFGGIGESSVDWRKALIASDAPTDYEDQLSLGVYAVAGIGPSRLEPDTSQVPGWDPNDRVEPAGQITIGADLTKHLSIEAHSADLGSSGLSNNGVDSGRINYHIDGLSALLYAGGDRDRYRRQGLKAYGRLGVGVLENTPVGQVPFEKVNGTHVLFGAGVEYMTPIGVGVRAEAMSFDKDVQYAQLGMMYRMGRKTKIERPKLAAVPKSAPAPVIAAAAPPPPPPPPLPAAPVVDACDVLTGVLDGVGFHTDSAELTAESTLILDDVAYKLSSCAGADVEVSAHTDSVGSESYNQALSERRAQSVVDYLSARGIDRNQLTATAFGETSPIDTNATAEGRKRNRRVELYAR